MLFILSLPQALAQKTYGDNRYKADSDPKTLQARRYFQQNTENEFKKDKQRLGLNHIGLRLNHRMVAQYGRGKDSANAVIPKENEQILEFIAQIRSNPRAAFQHVSRLPGLKNQKKQDIAKALTMLMQTKMINIGYWGYLDRSENLPNFDAKRGVLNYDARWNERKSFYLQYSPDEMKTNILKGIITQMNTKSWFQKFSEINLLDFCD